MLHFSSVIGHIREHASSLAQHLGSAEQPPFLLSLGPGHSLFGLLGRANRELREPAARSTDSSTNDLLLQQGASSHANVHDLSPHQQQAQSGEGHSWSLLFLPWSSQDTAPAAASQAASSQLASDSPDASTFSSISAKVAVRPRVQPSDWSEPTPPLVVLLLLGPTGVQAILASRLSGLVVMWHSAVSLQQRAVLTALWHAGRAVEAAERACRSIPPPHEVPDLVHWGAASAAVQAEETVVLALAHTATAASAAAARVPAATAAVTGSNAAAAAAAAVSAPHLPMLRHARRRLLAAATSLLEQLRSLRQGCTNHVLLRFVLFSSVSPALRRDLLMRLDILARRATQLAILQDQHEAWKVLQPALPHGADPLGQSVASPFAGPGADVPTTAPGSSLSVRYLHSLLLPGAGRIAGGPSGSTPSDTSALSARWFRSVFAPEMRACARQLRCGGVLPSNPPGGSSSPGDGVPSDPPGQFDLRDLYRLIRVVEVAVEDLERYV